MVREPFEAWARAQAAWVSWLQALRADPRGFDFAAIDRDERWVDYLALGAQFLEALQREERGGQLALLEASEARDHLFHNATVLWLEDTGDEAAARRYAQILEDLWLGVVAEHLPADFGNPRTEALLRYFREHVSLGRVLRRGRAAPPAMRVHPAFFGLYWEPPAHPEDVGPYPAPAPGATGEPGWWATLQAWGAGGGEPAACEATPRRLLDRAPEEAASGGFERQPGAGPGVYLHRAAAPAGDDYLTVVEDGPTGRAVFVAATERSVAEGWSPAFAHYASLHHMARSLADHGPAFAPLPATFVAPYAAVQRSPQGASGAPVQLITGAPRDTSLRLTRAAPEAPLPAALELVEWRRVLAGTLVPGLGALVAGDVRRITEALREHAAAAGGERAVGLLERASHLEGQLSARLPVVYQLRQQLLASYVAFVAEGLASSLEQDRGVFAGVHFASGPRGAHRWGPLVTLEGGQRVCAAWVDAEDLRQSLLHRLLPACHVHLVAELGEPASPLDVQIPAWEGLDPFPETALHTGTVQLITALVQALDVALQDPITQQWFEQGPDKRARRMSEHFRRTYGRALGEAAAQLPEHLAHVFAPLAGLPAPAVP